MSTTSIKPDVRTLSVRVPEELYGEARRVAENRKISVNTLVSEALTQVVNEAQDKEMYDAATLLGLDAELSSVDFSLSAQSEVALGNE